ncbi:Zinc finger CCHC-type and RNA-binding motif-containing protein 1 [Chamberlinius hualienensis]
MSGGLAPSKSTVYVSNLPFSLTNNDLHKVFEKYGKVVKVTVVKDRESRKSKGVAFVLYLDRESAYNAVKSLNNKTMFDRTLKCSIAVDNGRSTEFIRRKDYQDKSRCFECGEIGHLSYKCPKNALGAREPPKKKQKKKRKFKSNDPPTGENEEIEDEDEEEEEEVENPALDTLSAAIAHQRQLDEEAGASCSVTDASSRKKFRPNNYFSDEEEEVDD